MSPLQSLLKTCRRFGKNWSIKDNERRSFKLEKADTPVHPYVVKTNSFSTAKHKQSNKEVGVPMGASHILVLDV